ncbi:MAG: GAF domain-containing protein [Chloroflexota bacterium]
MNEMREMDSMLNERQRQVGSLLAGLLALAGAAFLLFIHIVIRLQSGKMDLSDYVMLSFSLLMTFGNLSALVMLRQRRHLAGAWLSYLVSMVAFPLAATLVLKGVVFVTMLSTLFFTVLYVRQVFPSASRNRVIVLAIGTFLLLTGIEAWNPPFRVQSDFFAPVVGAVIMTLVAAGFVAYFARRAMSGNIRTKMVAGILATGFLSLLALSVFALSRAARLVNTFSGSVERLANQLAQEQIINTINNEANRADSAFNNAVTQVEGVAHQLELLQEQKNALGSGSYWDASVRLTRYSDGQYFNSRYSPSSVFVPSTVELTDEAIRELNVTAYLDFSAPFVLENNPQITAVYFTDKRGIITYYPNIRLGESLPHNYDATAQPTFRVATPLFNKDRSARWSFPRQDPAGRGLVVSVSVPVYFKDEFLGVMTADFQLAKIAEQINAIKVGASGYAFLVDSDGHVIAMPPQGYELMGLQPERLEMNEEPQQTIFDGNLPLEVRQITLRMLAGGSGIITAEINGVENFIAYAPLANRTFSLGLIVPVEELIQPVTVTRNEITAQVGETVRSAAIIMTLLLAAAVTVSLGLGQVLAAPILRLTQTANQILEGNLAAQADIRSQDEIGTLAQAFNAMTARLRGTLEGLERSVEERTAQLLEANANIERRAKKFQSIAHVARTISSNLELDSLLKQITVAISREFGFYHVGVFLLDNTGEYAVLSAANSPGGQRMLARGHRLKVGETGLVGYAAGAGKPRIALDTGADAVFFNNPDLPDTRSEIALPLRAGETVIGVLDVQSTEPNAFTEEDITTLSILADQVSIAIQNARQNEETRQALAEAEILSKQFVRTGWRQFTKQQKLLGVRHTGAQTFLLRVNNSKEAQEILQSAKPLKAGAGGAMLSIPITLRGQTIGSVDIRAPGNRQWDQDELDIVNAILERAAIAMENARLLAESQKRAAKEHAIGEISAKISALSDVEELLKAAALELKRALPETEVVVQLQSDALERRMR